MKIIQGLWGKEYIKLYNSEPEKFPSSMLRRSEVWKKFANFSDESSDFTFKTYSDEKTLFLKNSTTSRPRK